MNVDAVIEEAVEKVVREAGEAIKRKVAEMTAMRLSEVLGGGPRRGASRRAKGEISKWAADRRARRVPNFVIEATGLKTKKAIVAKFGEGAIFSKGKPLPKARA